MAFVPDTMVRSFECFEYLHIGCHSFFLSGGNQQTFLILYDEKFTSVSADDLPYLEQLHKLDVSINTDSLLDSIEITRYRLNVAVYGVRQWKPRTSPISLLFYFTFAWNEPYSFS